MTTMDEVLDKIEKIYADYAFIPLDGIGDIVFTSDCKKEVRELLEGYLTQPEV